MATSLGLVVGWISIPTLQQGGAAINPVILLAKPVPFEVLRPKRNVCGAALMDGGRASSFVRSA